MKVTLEQTNASLIDRLNDQWEETLFDRQNKIEELHAAISKLTNVQKSQKAKIADFFVKKSKGMPMKPRSRRSICS
jgi:hypothetical protein